VYRSISDPPRRGLRLTADRKDQMEFSSPVITLEVEGHVATLWLDRPESRNALGSAFWKDLPLAAMAWPKAARFAFSLWREGSALYGRT